MTWFNYSLFYVQPPSSVVLHVEIKFALQFIYVTSRNYREVNIYFLSVFTTSIFCNTDLFFIKYLRWDSSIFPALMSLVSCLGLLTCLTGVTFAPPPQVLSTKRRNQWQTFYGSRTFTSRQQMSTTQTMSLIVPRVSVTWIFPGFLMCFHDICMTITSWEMYVP